MSVLKRHAGRRRRVGRRVAGVGLGVALLVLGLQAPAYAVTPTVTSFTPSSGPAGCVVQIIGSNFTNPIVTGAAGVQFGGVNAVNYVVKSDTEIWAMAPGPGFITVTNVSGTGSSASQFLAATPGGCAPTADSFTPACGPAAGPPGGLVEDATAVTVTGTNLMLTSAVGAVIEFSLIPPGFVAPETTPPTPPTLTERKVVVPAGASDGPLRADTFVTSGLTTTQFDVGTCITGISPTTGDVGTTVTITGVGFKNVTQVKFFNGIPAVFTLTTDTNTTDTITATVPFGAATGPITLFTVEAGNGTSVNSTDFTIGGPLTHDRNVTLKLSGSLTMKGKVKVPDGFTDCASGVSVKLQRKKSGGGWKTLKTVTTSDTGAYSGKVSNKKGTYRSVAPKTTAGGETCNKDVSPTRKN